MVELDMSNINDTINKTVENVKEYINSLSDKEKIGWILIIVGIILMIVSAFLW